VVAALDPDVESVDVGARVTVEPDLPCWKCTQCRRDHVQTADLWLAAHSAGYFPVMVNPRAPLSAARDAVSHLIEVLGAG
jgi:threonine dehydrogenase-like Zn-dependent dehydrogenase